MDQSLYDILGQLEKLQAMPRNISPSLQTELVKPKSDTVYSLAPRPKVPELPDVGDYVNEPPLRIPGPSRARSAIDAFIAELGRPRQIPGSARGGDRFMASLMQGFGSSYSKARLSDEEERRLFAENQREQTMTRVKERDAAFKDAKTKAEAVKKERIGQMRTAKQKLTDQIQDIDVKAATAFDDAGRQSLQSVREERVGRLQKIENDLAKLEKRTPEKFETPTFQQRPDRLAGKSGNGQPDVAYLSPTGLRFAAEYLLKTGEMLPFGMKSTKDRMDVVNTAAEMRREAGDTRDMGVIKADFKANSASLKNMQAMVDNVTAFENTALANSKLLLEAMGSIPDTGVPVFNIPVRMFAKHVQGSPEYAAYDVAQRVVVPEFAKIITNPNLTGVLTNEARNEIFAALDPNATFGQMVKALQMLKNDASNRTKFYNEQLATIKGRMTKPDLKTYNDGKGNGSTSDSTGTFQWPKSSLGTPGGK